MTSSSGRGGQQTSTLNCLGNIQKNYVNSVVNEVQFGNGGTSFKNVMFEIMNEAPQSGTWGSVPLNEFVKFHNTVATWIKTDPTDGTPRHFVVTTSFGNDASRAELQACTSTSCNNPWQIFFTECRVCNAGGVSSDGRFAFYVDVELKSAGRTVELFVQRLSREKKPVGDPVL